MSASSQGASGSAGNTRRTNTPPTGSTSQPQPSRTPPTTAPGSRPNSAPKAHKQVSSGQLSSKVMSSAKSFESARSSRGSRDSLIARASKTPEVPPLPNPKEELLKSLQTHFESLRNIITCNICYGLLYEPYTTTCGHTYCYVCFCKSFLPNQVPSCPECRGRLATPPAPAYVVREMTHAFLARPELLPGGETIEQHKQWQKEHADIIQTDKDNKNPRDGGLWRGIFRRRFPRRLPIRDWEDGVDRCPFCTWELEDGMCNRCGLPFDENGDGNWEFSDIASEHPSIMAGHDIVIDEYDPEDDFIDDEVEHDWQDFEGGSIYDDESIDMEHPWTIQRMLGVRTHHGPPPVRRRAAHSAAGGRSRYSASLHESEMGTLEEEEEEDDEDSSMSGFVVGDDDATGFSRESTSASDSHSSSRFPESIAEGDEEDEDDGPVVPGRRRMPNTVSSNSTLTTTSQRPGQTRPPPSNSQPVRRRRIISETPSTESTSSAAAEDDEDQGPVAPASRRRRRGLSQDEPIRRVRPRPRGNSIPDDEASDPWGGYRPIGTPQIGDGEDEQSDGGRTAVGWEPITHPIERLRNTGSLTPTADRPSAPARPASRISSTFPLGSRGIRRRSSVVSIVHYEDNDADDDGSDTQQSNTHPALHPRTSRTQLANTMPQSTPIMSSVPAYTMDGGGDTDSGENDLSPQAALRGQANRRRREYDPYISMVFAQHQTEVQSTDPEGPVYAEFEHLRGIVRTPVARPRTSNRNRMSGTAQSPAQHALLPGASSGIRNLQQLYSPSRYRAPIEMGQPMVNSPIANVRSAADRPSNSPRGSISGPAQLANATRYRAVVSDVNGTRPAMVNHQVVQTSMHLGSDQRVQSSNAALQRAMNNPSNVVGSGAAQATRMQQQSNLNHQPPRNHQFNDFIERPISRVSSRAGFTINRPPSVVNRAPPTANRPPSAGSRRGSLTRSPFAPPQIGPAGVGLNTARTWHPNNPFFRAVRARPSSQRLRNEPSTQTLRSHPSVRHIRNAPPQAESPEPDQDSPQMRPQASRLHLRPQISYRRLHVQRDANLGQYQQVSAPPVTRHSPAGANTLSEDERNQRASELVRRRALELAQQQNSAPAQNAQRMQAAAAAQQRMEQRLASTMGRMMERNAAQPTQFARPTQPPATPSAGSTVLPAVTLGQVTNARANSSRAPNSMQASNSTNTSTVQPQQRTTVESSTNRSQAPVMAQGVTAITTGGDDRRY